MNAKEQVKNIISFLCVIFGEELGDNILRVHPDYLIEKYNLYLLSETPKSEWGLHPALRNKLFNLYLKKYKDFFDHE